MQSYNYQLSFFFKHRCSN